MECPKCSFKQPTGSTECGKCGIIFSKYDPPKTTATQKNHVSATGEKTAEFDFFHWLRDLLFYVEPDVNLFYFLGRAVLFLVLAFYFFRYVTSSMESCCDVMSFMHLVNLPFHEAGHIIFMPFGRFIMFLGGTLGQLLMPLACMAVLLISAHNTFGASASLWWFGQNFIDVAPYIDDARTRKLILLGGVTGRETDGHDWENILYTLGWIQHDHMLAKWSYAIGIVLMVVALAWGGYILYWQYQGVKEFHRDV